MAHSAPVDQATPPSRTLLARAGRPQAWRRAFFLYVLVSVLANVWQAGLGSWLATADFTARSRQWAARDQDIAGFLLPGLRLKPTLLSTLDWWHDTWAGIVPFWRPLTSLAFWLEYHTFTPDRFDRWMMLSYACHLGFVALLVLLVRRLTGRWGVGALTVLLFAGSTDLWPLSLGNILPGGKGSAPCNVALDSWKNQPELWAGICTLAAALLALRERWAWALAWAVLGVCFKESGWYTFPIVFLVLAQQRRLGTVPRWVYGAVAASIAVLVLLRAWAGPEMFRGYHYGSNGNWRFRYSTAVEGPYLFLLESPRAAAGVLGTALFALAAWRRGPVVPRVLLGVGAFALCGGLYGVTSGGGWAVGCVALLDPSQLLFDTLISACWLFVAWCLLRRRDSRGLVLALLLITLISAGSLAAAGQVQSHVLYLTYAFQSCLTALGLAAVANDLARVWARSQGTLGYLPRKNRLNL